MGECPKHCKNATVSVQYSGRKRGKTDLQKTYNEVGRECSLLIEVEGVAFALCIKNCPLVIK